MLKSSTPPPARHPTDAAPSRAPGSTTHLTEPPQNGDFLATRRYQDAMALAVTPGAVPRELNVAGGSSHFRGESTQGALPASTGWKGPDAGAVQSGDSRGTREKRGDIDTTNPGASGGGQPPSSITPGDRLGSSGSGGLRRERSLPHPGAPGVMDRRERDVANPQALSAAPRREGGLRNPAASGLPPGREGGLSDPGVSNYSPEREGGVPNPQANCLTPGPDGAPPSPLASSVAPGRQGAQPNPQVLSVAQGVDICTPDAGAVRPRVSKALEVHEKWMRENPQWFKVSPPQQPVHGSIPRPLAHPVGVEGASETPWDHAAPVAVAEGICTSGAGVLRTRPQTEEGGYPLHILSSRKTGTVVRPEGGSCVPRGTPGRIGGPLLPSTRINAPPLASPSSPFPQGKGVMPCPSAHDCSTPGLRSRQRPVGEAVARPTMMPASEAKLVQVARPRSPCAPLDSPRADPPSTHQEHEQVLEERADCAGQGGLGLGLATSHGGPIPRTHQEHHHVLEERAGYLGQGGVDPELASGHGGPLELVSNGASEGGDANCHVVGVLPVEEAGDEPAEDHISDSETECAGEIPQISACHLSGFGTHDVRCPETVAVFVCVSRWAGFPCACECWTEPC
jgi:hypothetical protein